MKQLIGSLLILISTSLFSQSNDLHKIEVDTGFTWQNSTASERDSFYLNLPVVRNTSFKTHIRVSLLGQRVDLVSNNNKQFSGTLTNTITKYKTAEKENGGTYDEFQVVSNKIQLDSSISSFVASRIIESGQSTYPTDSLIHSWNGRYLHCSSINFQFNINGNFVEQSYYCPWSQAETIELKDIIVSNYNLLEEQFQLKTKYNDFNNLLEKGNTYSKDGYLFQYIMTPAEEEMWERSKPKREYLKSIKDTVNNYLNINLQRLQSSSDSIYISCFTCDLTFAQNGRLKKIWFNPNDNMKLKEGIAWFIEDRVEVLRCKRRIRKIFRKINLKDFDLEYPIHRTLYAGFLGKLTIVDNTIY